MPRPVNENQATNWLWGLSAAIFLLIVFFVIFGVKFNHADTATNKRIDTTNSMLASHEDRDIKSHKYLKAQIDTLASRQNSGYNYLDGRIDGLASAQKKTAGQVWWLGSRVKKLETKIYSDSSSYSYNSSSTNETVYVDAEEGDSGSEGSGED